MGIGWLVALVGMAWAGEASVESAAYPTREEAMVVFEAVEAGLGEGAAERPRLVRRYQQGEGWRYIVIIENMDGPRAEAVAGLAEGLTAILPEAAEAPRQPRRPTPAPVVEATPEPEPAAEPRKVPRGERMPEADDLLEAAVKAHGGTEGAGNRLRAASTLRFSYERIVPVSGGTLVAHNEFLRRGDALRLEIEIREGEGVDSTTTLTEEQKGFVAVDGEVLERDGGRTLEMLERFSPEAVLSIPLGLPEDVETAAAWRGLETVRQEEVSGQQLWIVKGNVQDDGMGLREAAFDAEQQRLVWVVWAAESGEVTFRYTDYRTLGEDLVVPFKTRIERDGALVEEISVALLELDPELEARLFVGSAQE